MAATYYFADVVTTGSTLISGTASFQGAFNYFNSNIVGSGTIGSSATPFGSLYVRTGNIGNVTLTSFVSNVGIGTAATANALSVLGNLFGSSSIGTTNVAVTLANVSTLNVNSITNFVGIGTTSASGTSLFVSGNVFGSVGLGSPSIFATNSNVTVGTLGSLLVTSNVGIGTGPGGTPLAIQGNFYASNSISTGTVNGTLANVSSFTGNSVSVSINVANLIVGTVNTPTLNAGSLTMSVLVASSLGWSNSNIIISNFATTTGNFTAGGTITYGEDLTMRSPHLLPTPSNAATIQAWISGTCNAASKPTMSWWDTSPVSIFTSVAISSSGYTGCVLLPDGRVLFVSSGSGRVGFFNPFTGSTSIATPSGSSLGSYFGGVLVPSGNVVFIPSSPGSIGIYNPISNRLSYGATVSSSTSGGTLDQNGNVVMVGSKISTYNPSIDTYSSLNINFDGQFQGAVLTPNGNIVCIPYTNSNVAEFQPSTSAVSNTVKVGTPGVNKFSGGVLAPNGNIICVPYASNVGIYNPSNSTLSNVATGSGGFSGGCLLPNGNVVFVPKTASNVGLFDPVALAYSNSTGVNSLSFAGGCLIPDGRVIFAPYSTTYVGVLDTMTPVSQEFCLSPYFNKF